MRDTITTNTMKEKRKPPPMTDDTTSIEINLPADILYDRKIILNFTTSDNNDTTNIFHPKPNNKDEKIKKTRTPQTPENIYTKIKNYLLTKVKDNQTMSPNTIYTRIFAKKTIDEHKKEMEDALKQLEEEGVLTKIEKTTPKRGEVVTYVINNDREDETDVDEYYEEDNVIDIESMNVREIELDDDDEGEQK